MKYLGNGLLLISLFFTLCLPSGVSGSPNIYSTSEKKIKQPKPEEVFLSFNYKNLFNKVIIALYDSKNDQFYLPVSAVFSALKIPHEVSLSPPVISGSYLESDNRFQFHFQEYTASLDNKGSFTYDNTKMLIRETDFYVTPQVLNEVLDLQFSVDFNNLILKLETPNEPPVLAQYRRKQERNQEERISLIRDYYDLKYDRNRQILSGGFLDYSLSGTINDEVNNYSLNTQMGIEFLGGDLQGSTYARMAGQNGSLTTDNFRWRYALKDNNILTQAIVGQTNSSGLDRRSFIGLKLTNEPVQPRYIFDEFEIEGTAPPGSEVELYFNDALYAFQEITQNGQYRFLAPISYGSSRLRLRIYNPAGDTREIAQRIQVPFQYLPPNKWQYHLNVGKLDNAIIGNTQTGYIGQGDIGYGISENLTQKFGFEYLNQYSGQSPLFYSSTSARVLQEHLLNFDAAPSAFYRFSANAVYPASSSWNLSYTNFQGNGIYNSGNNDHEFNGGFYLPISISDFTAGFRLSSNHSIRNDYSITRYSFDVNTRINNLNFRFRYSDTKQNKFNLTPSPASEISTFATYSFGNDPDINDFFEGLFMRGGVRYRPNSSQIINAEAQIARSIFENGRIQASVSRNFDSGYNLFGLSLSIDLNNARLSSNARFSRSSGTLTQNLTGSIGFNDNENEFVLSNRRQVGRAASSVRLYVDKNNSGSYDEEDDIIKNNAIRVGRSSNSEMDKDGTIYLSQLQPYDRVNMEINKAAIQNPMLVPELENFSIITDPNQYKPINIPFYVSGVISGQVMRQTENGSKKGVSGLRVYLADSTGSIVKEMQTFSDGSYYAYEIPPGGYKLYIDRKQLTFLQSVSKPDTMNINIEPMAEGDFEEGLNFTLLPKPEAPAVTEDTVVIAKTDSAVTDTTDKEEKNIAITDTSDTTDINLTTSKDSIPQFFVQLASFQTLGKSKKVAASAKKFFDEPFYVTKNTNTGLYSIRSGLIANTNKYKVLQSYKKEYREAAIVEVVKPDEHLDSGTSANQYILGIFASQDSSDAFAKKLIQEINAEIAVRYNADSDKYQVILKEDLRNSQEKRKLLLKHLVRVPERPMDLRLQLQIKNDSLTSSDSVSKRLSVKYPEIIVDKNGKAILIRNIPDWNTTLAIKKDLNATYEIEDVIYLFKEIIPSSSR